MTIGSLSSLHATGPVQSAIAAAARRTGIDFTYLLGQAQVESSLRPDARAATSSAAGLYQFIDQSWLGTVKRHGAEHGLGWAADAIGQTASGRFYVSDPGTRAQILKLRDDPRVASLMAAAHAADNKAELEARFGREMGGADLYMAHFLGLGGAQKFLAALDADPGRAAAPLFPAAAAANRGVFFGSDGRPRSVAEIYDRFAAKLQRGAEIAAGGKPLPPLAEPGNAAPAFRHAVVRHEGTATLDQLLAQEDRASLLRPRPETARLAYLMLASMGG